MSSEESEEVVEVSGKLVLVGDDGWFCIERAEHDGREWFEPIGENSSMFCRSARISDADVEGPSEHMLMLAEAIRRRGRHSSKRCAVDATGDRVLLWSPRNSFVCASVSIEAADDLVSQIDAQLSLQPRKWTALRK